jgi:hypothetical protein
MVMTKQEALAVIYIVAMFLMAMASQKVYPAWVVEYWVVSSAF